MGDESASSIVVQWPSMNHAMAYVVELHDTQRTERFVRSVPPQAPGILMKLAIGGLQTSHLGQCYSVQVRCIAACGCESEASPVSVLQAPMVMPMMTAPQLPPTISAAANPCVEAPPCTDGRFVSGIVNSGVEGIAPTGCCSEQEKQVYHQLPQLRSVPAGARPSMQLPSLLVSRMPMAPPPARPAPQTFEPVKEIPAEIVRAVAVTDISPENVVL